MADINNQPPFWLEVKKEYVFDNFDKLFNYLRDYNYVEENEKEDGDFNRTFMCLQELVDDYIDQAYNDNLFENKQQEWGNGASFVFRMIATYLLVAHSKKNYDDHQVLAKLADMLILRGQLNEDTLNRYKELLICCIQKCPILKLGYSWKNLTENVFSIDLLSYQVSMTTFNLEIQQESFCYEGKGLLLVSPTSTILTPTNRKDYWTYRNNLYTIFSKPAGIDILSQEKVSANLTFEQLKRQCASIITQQQQVTPTPAKTLKMYTTGEEVTVRVTGYGRNTLIAETIDPDYETIKGEVSIVDKYAITKQAWLQYVKVNDYLLVTIRSNGKFDLIKSFDSMYESWANDAIGQTYKAKYADNFATGHRWLSEEGFQINVRQAEFYDDIQMAIDDEQLVAIKITSSKRDKAGNVVLGGTYIEVLDEYVSLTFEQKAMQSIVSDYVANSQPEEKAMNDLMAKPLAETFLSPLTHVIYHLSTFANDTTERYIILFVSQMLAQLHPYEADLAYITHEMDYIYRLVSFAHGTDAYKSPLTHDTSLEQVEEVLQHESIIQLLQTYKQPELGLYTLPSKVSTQEDNLIEPLIEASNTLSGKISLSEINRIKKTIVTHLGVQDLYQNITHDTTYYGEESDTLEFKTSIVYLPNSKPDPNKQKWAILKTICGFLNTVSGGELLLGVNDYGNANGLQADIDYLFQTKLITEPSMDKYRNYVKYLTDYAFIDEEGMMSNTEITSTRIKYVIEVNNEGYHVLRIQVSPYEYGVVSFASKERPEGIASSYYRTSGASMPINATIKREVREKKLSAASDANISKMLQLQKALKDKKVVVLKGYSSSLGVLDRKAEVFHLYPERKAVIAYDISKKELREFKVTRFDSIQITDENWKNANKHKLLHIDAFDMLESPQVKPIKVVLKLNQLAYNLLKEEYPNARQDVTENKGADKIDYPYLLDTEVFGIKGIGRYYIGLAQEIKIVEGDELKAYAKEYVKLLLQ